MKKLLIVSLFLSILANSVLSCSFVKASYKSVLNSGCVIARTMDYELNFKLMPACGKKGISNISSVNSVPNLSEDKIMTWTNSYKFIGIPFSPMGDIVDGINEEGLYCGQLYLPNCTKFPEYDPTSPNKVISYVNLSAYFLGTCDSVESAIKKLSELQVLGSTVSAFGVFPLHLVLADKTGDSALIEYVDGKIQVYRNGVDKIDLNVVTNSPAYPWHLNDYNDKSINFTPENTDVKWDGLYMNGSGFAGSDDNNTNCLAGDWTPPSRFNRATAILNYGPTPKDLSQAFCVVEQTINSVTAPLGLNSAPTNWISMANLKDGIYYFKALQLGIVSIGKFGIQARVPNTKGPSTYKAFSVQDYKPKSTLRFFNTKITRPIIKYDYEKQYIKMQEGGAKPGSKYKANFVSILHASDKKRTKL